MTSLTATRPRGSGLFRYSIFTLFIAGFISAVVFQMGMTTILNLLGMPTSPFPMGATKPFGVPQMWSLAFWAGIWGIVFGAAEKYFPAGPGYWLAALAFGAVLPTLVLWFVVFPLKGIPVAAGWDAKRMIAHLINHGAWGLGTAFLLRWRP